MPIFVIAFRDKQFGNRPFGQGSCGRQLGKAALELAFEVWVRAHGQATGCVTRQFETGNLGTGRLGKAVEAGSSEKAALVCSLEVWVRAQGQSTGCVTGGVERGNLGTGRLGKAVGAGCS